MRFKPETLAVHAGADPEAFHGSLSVPIYQSSVFRLRDVAHGAAVHEGDARGFFYGRMGTPTQSALEAALAELEGGDAALALASGMSAISSVLLALVEPGEHLVVSDVLYTSMAALLRDLVEPSGVRVTRVDLTDLHALERAIEPATRAVYLETPSNPMLSIVDIEAVAAVAHAQRAHVVVDNTFATPINQQPLAFGADVVVHSVTKYIGGHGDLVAGAIVSTAEIVDRVRWSTLRLLGGAIAPHTAWLALRGVRTLALRMGRHNANAQSIAAFLEERDGVARVHYPGLRAHPGHSIARRQMRGFGGVVSFDVGGLERARRLVESLRLITLGVSLGDVATLIQPAAALTQASLTEEEKHRAGISPGLIRLSVGIEDAGDLIDDLDHALDHM